MKKNYILTAVFALLISAFSTYAQVSLPYTENFSGQNDQGAVGTGSDTNPVTDLEGVNWSVDISAASLTATSDWFKVVSEVFEARDIDGESIWLSPTIDISSAAGVQFSLEAEAIGGMESSDFFKTEYRINGSSGTWLVADTNGNLVDDFNETLGSPAIVQQSGISGSTLEIRVTMHNGADAEKHRLDNISVSESSAPSISNVSSNVSYPTSSDVVTVSADVTATNGIASVSLKWGTTSGSLTNTVAMTVISGDTYSADIPAQADATTVFYEVEVTDNNAASTSTSEFDYTVIDPIAATLPYTIDFSVNNPSQNNWMYEDVNGSKSWSWISGTGAQMNGWSTCQEEDWMISPVFDLSATSNEVLSYELTQQYGSDNLELLYSTDYNGDVATATWTNLETIASVASGSSIIDVDGNIVISNITGSSVYFAFKYLTIENCSKWTVEKVSLEENTTLSNSSVALESISLYPNPTATGAVSIVSAKDAAIAVEAYNLLGAKVLATSLTDATLDVSGLNAGVYILKITQDDATATKKLVIK